MPLGDHEVPSSPDRGREHSFSDKDPHFPGSLLASLTPVESGIQNSLILDSTLRKIGRYGGTTRDNTPTREEADLVG